MIFDKHKKIKEYVRKLGPEIFGFKIIRKIKVFKLPRGNWNYNYVVEINQKLFVFKIYGREGKHHLFQNSASCEYKSLRSVERLDIGPKPTYLDETKSIIKYPVVIYEYLHGQRLAFSTEPIIKMAENLAKLHSVSINKLNFLEEIDERTDTMIENIRKEFEDYKNLKKVNPYKVLLFEELIQKARKWVQKNKCLIYPKRMVHGDLVPSNIIVSTQEAKIIDWQNPVKRDPAYDVWGFLSKPYNLWDLPTTVSERQKKLFLKRYIELTGDKNIVERIKIKEPLYLLSIALYVAKADYDYKSKNLPADVITSRRKNFERYERILLVIFDSLSRVLSN